MTEGYYYIDDKIWDTISKKRYLTNNILVLGFVNKRVINYASTKYKDIYGISIDPRRGVLEFSKGKTTCIVPIDKNPESISLSLEDKEIKIKIISRKV